MTLADTVTVARRFQRSVRIDMDLGDPAALEGFICPPSAANVLREMARHIVETGHCAFTWTGPYGSGKSSLAVAFSALLNGNTGLRGEAVNAFGDSTASELHAALPPKADGWHILPVVGRRDRPEQVIGEALMDSSLVRGKRRRRVWRERHTIDALLELAQRNPDTSGGLIVLIDEMGKFLEGAAHGIADVYFFQQLAEMASRSERRLLLIGVLHQAFEEYAFRLSRDAQDEWSKIQGRFLDLAVNTAVDEQLSLLGRAIDNGRPAVEPNALSRTVAELTLPPKSPELPTLLEQWSAAASRRIMSAWTYLPTAFWAESAEYLWVLELDGAVWLPRLSAEVFRGTTLPAAYAVGLPALQLGAVHYGFAGRPPLGGSGRCP